MQKYEETEEKNQRFDQLTTINNTFKEVKDKIKSNHKKLKEEQRRSTDPPTYITTSEFQNTIKQKIKCNVRIEMREIFEKKEREMTRKIEEMKRVIDEQQRTIQSLEECNKKLQHEIETEKMNANERKMQLEKSESKNGELENRIKKLKVKMRK